jgi:SAM-dependent methyltransferase
MAFGQLVNHQFESKTLLAEYDVHDLSVALLGKLKADPEDNKRLSYASNQTLLACFQQLKDALEKRLATKSWRLSPLIQADMFRFVDYARRKYGLCLRNIDIADIGCGSINPYGRMFTHILAGARNCHCFELAPIYDRTAAIKILVEIYNVCMVDPKMLFGDYSITRSEIVENLYGFDIGLISRGDQLGIDSSRLQYNNKSASETDLLSSSIDLVVSNSVLEHINNLDDSIAEFSRITKPGGYGIHGVDFIDHRWYSDPNIHPLEFLRIDTSDSIVHGSNRLRQSDITELFKKNGFEVLDTSWRSNKVEISFEFKQSLASPWNRRSNDDLEYTWCPFLVKKM